MLNQSEEESPEQDEDPYANFYNSQARQQEMEILDVSPFGGGNNDYNSNKKGNNKKRGRNKFGKGPKKYNSRNDDVPGLNLQNGYNDNEWDNPDNFNEQGKF